MSRIPESTRRAEAMRALLTGIALGLIVTAFFAGAAIQRHEDSLAREDSCSRIADPIGCVIIMSDIPAER